MRKWLSTATQILFVLSAGFYLAHTPEVQSAYCAIFTSTLSGCVPASGGGTANFLRADKTWAPPSGGSAGTVTINSTTVSGSTGGELLYSDSSHILQNQAAASCTGNNNATQYNSSTPAFTCASDIADLDVVQTFTAAQTFGEVHGATETVTLSSNNYNAVVADCGKTKKLPTGTTPTVTLPNINPTSGSCTIVFVTTATISYKFQAASGGTVNNTSAFFNTRGTNPGDTVVVILTTPSGSAAVWDASGDLTS